MKPLVRIRILGTMFFLASVSANAQFSLIFENITPAQQENSDFYGDVLVDPWSARMISPETESSKNPTYIGARPPLCSISAMGQVKKLTVCHTGCLFPSLQDAVNAASDGDTIEVKSGIYLRGARIDVPGLKIVGEPGTHFRGAAILDKATFITAAPGITIAGIECSESTVPDDNGACVRIEAPDLTISNVHFHDNQDGILGGSGGGTTLIEDSLFERNGYNGYAHSIYIGKGVDTFILRNTKIIDTKSEGHAVKSRARNTLIENNVIDGDLVNSREIDVPNGGNVVIRYNWIRKGPRSANRDMFGIALEAAEELHELNRTVVTNNLLILEKPGGRLFTSRSPDPMIFLNNEVRGRWNLGFARQFPVLRFE